MQKGVLFKFYYFHSFRILKRDDNNHFYSDITDFLLWISTCCYLIPSFIHNHYFEIDQPALYLFFSLSLLRGNTLTPFSQNGWLSWIALRTDQHRTRRKPQKWLNVICSCSIGTIVNVVSYLFTTRACQSQWKIHTHAQNQLFAVRKSSFF